MMRTFRSASPSDALTRPKSGSTLRRLLSLCLDCWEGLSALCKSLCRWYVRRALRAETTMTRTITASVSLQMCSNEALTQKRRSVALVATRCTFFELVQKLQDQLRKQQDVLNDHVRRTAVVSPEPATSSVTSGRSPIVGEPVGSSVDPQFARIGVASPAAGARSGDGGDGPASPEPGQTAAEGRGLLGRGDDAKQIQSPPPPAYDS